jgi:hypothetical protein
MAMVRGGGVDCTKYLSGVGVMEHYRLYLMGTSGHIEAGTSLLAPHDDEAKLIAAVVYDSLMDAFPGYMLWRGTHCLAEGSRPLGKAPRLEDLVAARQRNAIELERTLLSSFNCVRQSKKLLDTLKQFNDPVPNSPGAEEVADKTP